MIHSWGYVNIFYVNLKMSVLFNIIIVRTILYFNGKEMCVIEFQTRSVYFDLFYFHAQIIQNM
jgi:hypothetical protein